MEERPDDPSPVESVVRDEGLDPAAFRPVFERCLGLVGSVAADFRVRMAHGEGGGEGGWKRRRNEGE